MGGLLIHFIEFAGRNQQYGDIYFEAVKWKRLRSEKQRQSDAIFRVSMQEENANTQSASIHVSEPNISSNPAPQDKRTFQSSEAGMHWLHRCRKREWSNRQNFLAKILDNIKENYLHSQKFLL